MSSKNSNTAPPGFSKETSDHMPHKSKHSISEDGTLSMVLFRPFGPDVPLGEFKQRLEMISSDLHHLLQLDTQDFWSMVSFDRSILRSIDSFLRFSPRHWFEIEKLPEDDEMQRLLQSVSRLMFLVLLRLATNRDTSRGAPQAGKVFLQPADFGQLIYDRHIWTIPMLFDVVALYGRKNATVLAKMIESIFNCQQKFTDDLAGAFSATELALRQLANQLDEFSLVKTHDSRTLLSQLSDMVVFSFDTFSTLETFVTLYQSSALVVEQTCTTLLAFCAEFADSTLQMLTRQLLDLAGKISCDKQDCSLLGVETLLKITAATEVRIVNTFHALLTGTCLRPPENVFPEQYFSALTTVMGHHRFVWLLNNIHPIASDVSLLEKNAKSSHGVDQSCKEYVTSAVYEARKMFEPSLYEKKPSPPPKQLKAAATGGPSEKEIAEMIQMVASVMGSNFSQVFIAKCLRRFDYDADALVQALLDDNLPPDLRDEQHEDENYEYSSENIEAALTSVHRGKRDTKLEADELKEMKPFYNKFANVVTIASTAPPQYGGDHQESASNWVNLTVPEMVYEDEYDDTYDDNGGIVGPANDELLRRRAFTVPRVLSAGADKIVDEESDSEEEEEEEQGIQEERLQTTRAPLSGGYGRGGWQGQGVGRGRGRGVPSSGDGQETERPPGPRSGDTRGFKGANRDRQKIETAAARGGQQQQQRPRSDYGRGGGGGHGGDRPARPLTSENRQDDETENNAADGATRQRQHHQQQPQHWSTLPEDMQRMRKERHKGNVGNHNRRDFAARKRREF